METLQLRVLAQRPKNIRNVALIGRTRHGKTTLQRSVLPRPDAPHSSSSPSSFPPIITTTTTTLAAATTAARVLLNQARTNKIPAGADGTAFLVNFVDTPGHPDHEFEAAAALRISDGALVVVDATQGPSFQTDRLLRVAVSLERVRPVLFINMVDRALLEFHMDEETLHTAFVGIIESVNASVAQYTGDSGGGGGVGGGVFSVSPESGTVAFGSALHGWAFTLRQFAQRYSKRFGVDTDKMTAKLWGDNYFDPATKRWTTDPNPTLKGGTTTSSSVQPLRRSFVVFVLEPIYKLFDAVMNARRDRIPGILQKLEVVLSADEALLEGVNLLKTIMRKFLPAADAVLDMVCVHLPSPPAAMAYRAQKLYDGPQHDAVATGIKQCDPCAPLVMNIVKLVPATPLGHRGRHYALGRVFSGTLRVGDKVFVQGPKYIRGKSMQVPRSNDLAVRELDRLYLLMDDGSSGGGCFVETTECPAGSFVCLSSGIDEFLKGLAPPFATVAGAEKAWGLRPLRVSVTPVVQRAIHVERADDQARIDDALQLLVRADPGLTAGCDSRSGAPVVSASSEPRLDRCLRDLAAALGQAGDADADADTTSAGSTQTAPPPLPLFKAGAAGTTLRETVQDSAAAPAATAVVCMATSPNRHSRLYMSAGPLAEAAAAALESGAADLRAEISAAAASQTQRVPLPLRAAADLGLAPPLPPTALCFRGPHAAAAGANVLLYEAQRDGGDGRLDSGSSRSNYNGNAAAAAATRALAETADLVAAGFARACAGGALTGEPVRGVRCALVDAVLQADTIHRGPAQIIIAAARAATAALLAAGPAVCVPRCRVEVVVEIKGAVGGGRGAKAGGGGADGVAFDAVVAAVVDCLRDRRRCESVRVSRRGSHSGGAGAGGAPTVWAAMAVVDAEVTGSRVVGLAADVQSAAAAERGQGMQAEADVLVVFDGWERVDGDVYQEGSELRELVMEVRRRKGMGGDVPRFQQFCDAL